MPVIKNNPFFASVDPLSSGRTGTPQTMEGEREYVQEYLVIIKKQGLDPLAISYAPLLPQIGSSYVNLIDARQADYDLLALARSISVRSQYQDDWQNQIVSIKYSTKMPPGGQTNNQNHPEKEPADIKWTTEIQQEAFRFDLKGKPFVNSAQMPFSPPPTFEKAYPVLNISRNELKFDLDKADYYSYAVNDRDFLGWPRGCAQCLPPEAEQKFRGNLPYWRVNYKIRFRTKGRNGNFTTPDGLPDTWQPRLLDQGMMEKIFVKEKPTSTTSGTTTSTEDCSESECTATCAEIALADNRWVSISNPCNTSGSNQCKCQMENIEDLFGTPCETDGQTIVFPCVPTDVSVFDPGPNLTVVEQLIHIRDASGKQVSGPVLLNGRGAKQTEKDRSGKLIPNFLDFETYRYADLIELIVRGVS